MHRLILMRHGKAEARSESGEDFDRRLAPRGVQQAAEMGAALAAKGFIPDLALVSAAARTRDTWAAAQRLFPDARAAFEDKLYDAEASVIADIARTRGEYAGTVLVIGHNPGMHELVVGLMMQAEAPDALLSRAHRGFPTSAAGVFRLEDGAVVAEDLLLPERED